MSALVLGAVLALAPLILAGHVHAGESLTSASCLVCTAAEHGASDLPVVACSAPHAVRVLPAPRPAPARIVVRSLAASPSRGPPTSVARSPH